MDTWKKGLIAFAIIIPLTIVLTLGSLNYAGIGDTLTGWFGPVTRGFYNIGATILNWGLANGWNMAILFISVPALMVAFAYVVWHWDWGYKIPGTSSSPAAAASEYSSTLKREPDEPERAPNAVAP